MMLLLKTAVKKEYEFEKKNPPNVDELGLLLRSRSGGADLEPLPSPPDVSAPSNQRGSTELSSQSK